MDWLPANESMCDGITLYALHFYNVQQQFNDKQLKLIRRGYNNNKKIIIIKTILN